MIAYFCLTNDLMFWFRCLPNSYVTHLTCIWDIYFLVHFDYPSFIGTAWHIDFFAHSLFNSVPAGLFRQISKQVSGVATDVPGQFACVFNLRLTSVPAYSFTGLGIECYEFQVS